MSSTPIDPDRVEPLARRPEWGVLVAIAIGGAVGAEARYGLTQSIPHRAGEWPWATLTANVVGSLLLGVLMTLLAVAAHPHRLIRPFVGVGMLGGFTTFSTFAVDTDTLVHDGRVPIALLYVATSLITCILGVAAGVTAVRALRATS